MTQPTPGSTGPADEITELLQPGPAEALAGLLDVPLPDLYDEDLPLMWHWVHLLDRPAQKDLGPEGHPVRGTALTPPKPGRRRMWAGGRVTSLRPLRVGEPATRVSRVESVADKLGRTGPLTFVAVRHVVRQGRRTSSTNVRTSSTAPDRDTAPTPSAVLPGRSSLPGRTSGRSR